MTRKALVIGIPSYPNFSGKGQRHDLKSTPKDAQDIANFLINYGRFEVQFLPETCIDGTYQVGERAIVKAKQLQEAIYNLFVQPKYGKLPQTALLFFAGHGLAITEYGETLGYLGTSDNNADTEKWGIPFDWLVKQLVKSSVPEQIIWLDCCHSGKLAKEIFQQANPQNQGIEDVSRCFIAACRDTEAAHGVDGHGLLTHLLLQGLDPYEYALGKAITNLELEAAVERTFTTHPKFRTYPQRPVFSHCGRAIYFWDGRKQESSLQNLEV